MLSHINLILTIIRMSFTCKVPSGIIYITDAKKIQGIFTLFRLIFFSISLVQLNQTGPLQYLGVTGYNFKIKVYFF